MKNKLKLSVVLFASFTCSIAGLASANEVFADSSMSSGLMSVDSRAAQDLDVCLNADLSSSELSRAKHACTRSLKASIPSYTLRSKILTKRGFIQLSDGKFKRACRDFSQAIKLDANNEYAVLGQGFTAVMDADYQGAVKYFNAGMADAKVKPLALYGRAMARELSGNVSGAYADYKAATVLLPSWNAPQNELVRFSAG